MKMNDDELFAKLSEAFEELYGPSESEDTSAASPFERDPLDSPSPVQEMCSVSKSFRGGVACKVYLL